MFYYLDLKQNLNEFFILNQHDIGWLFKTR